jgi:hypothetical protein
MYCRTLTELWVTYGGSQPQDLPRALEAEAPSETPTSARPRNPPRTRSYADVGEMGQGLAPSPPRRPRLPRQLSGSAADDDGGGGGGSDSEYTRQLRNQRSGGLSPVPRRCTSSEALTSLVTTPTARLTADVDSEDATMGGEPAVAAAPPTRRDKAPGGGAAGGSGSGGGGGGGRRRSVRRLSLPPFFVWLYGKLVAPLAAAAQRRRLDDDSYTCYASYLLLFLSDMSLLAAVMPMTMLLYSLLLTRKPRQYWQVGACSRGA